MPPRSSFVTNGRKTDESVTPFSCLLSKQSSPFPSSSAFSKDKDKGKKLDDESNSPTAPQSAFLGPTLWDKTLPYDGDTFQLEYMDLEEFLSENGIPPSPSQHDHSPHPPGLQPASSTAPSVMDLSSRASAPLHPGIPSPNCMQSPIRPGKFWKVHLLDVGVVVGEKLA